MLKQYLADRLASQLVMVQNLGFILFLKEILIELDLTAMETQPQEHRELLNQEY